MLWIGKQTFIMIAVLQIVLRQQLKLLDVSMNVVLGGVKRYKD